MAYIQKTGPFLIVSQPLPASLFSRASEGASPGRLPGPSKDSLEGPPGPWRELEGHGGPLEDRRVLEGPPGLWRLHPLKQNTQLSIKAQFYHKDTKIIPSLNDLSKVRN